MIQNTNYGASKTYVDTKVEKLTTSGLKAYTHDGATQGEIEVSNTYTPATLALRDANGRMQAADPASGATDKTLVTANWVSQSGAGRPNNLLHNVGNEEKSGDLTLHNILLFDYANYTNRCLNAKSPIFDLYGTTTSSWDIFLGRCVDKNGTEVERDYVRKGSNYILAEKWYTFADDDGNVYHPSISILFRTDTKIATFTVFGQEIARRQY